MTARLGTSILLVLGLYSISSVNAETLSGAHGDCSNHGSAAPLGAAPSRRITLIPIPELSVLGRVALVPRKEQVVVAGWGGRLLLYALPTAQARWNVKAHRGAVRALAILDDSRVASGGADGAVYLWDLKTGARIRRLLRGHSPVRGLAATAQWVAVTTDDGALRLLSRDGKVVRRVGERRHRARALAFSRDGATLASGTEGGELRLYSVPQCAQVRVIAAHKQWINAVAFSADGERVATAGFDKRTRLWNVASGKRLLSLRGHSRRPTAISFDHSGGRLATASLDRTVVLWDAKSGKLLRRIAHHRYQVSSVVFGAGDRFLLTASTDGYLRIFPMGMSLPKSAQRISRPKAGELIFRANTSGERMRIRLFDKNGKALPAGLKRLTYFLRSGPDDRQRAVDPKLVAFIYKVAEHFGRWREVVVISGYRSKRFNRLRTQQSRQVAKKSQHMLGKAIDMRISGVSITKLRRYVEKQRFGGVGFYADSNFVHIDSGKVRRWVGN